MGGGRGEARHRKSVSLLFLAEHKSLYMMHSKWRGLNLNNQSDKRTKAIKMDQSKLKENTLYL